MKNIYIYLLSSLLLATACDNDLDQAPANIASSSSLTDYTGVANAAYYYQVGMSTPYVVMAEFRSDNAKMFEPPFTEFDEFGPGLTTMEDQFFGPFYTQAYRCIVSTNNVIANSSSESLIGEAKFLRALAYFKLVLAFGDVPVNLSAQIDYNDLSLAERQPAADVYNDVIIPDLTDAIATLSNSDLVIGRASKLAAQALLGKVYMHRGNFTDAETQLSAVVSAAAGAGVSLEDDFAQIFNLDNQYGSEIIFATKRAVAVVDEYTFASEFPNWFVGSDTKAPQPLDLDLVAAFDAAGDTIRKAITVDEATETGIKFSKEDAGEHDYIEIRLADVILLYAEALNENDTDAATVLALLDDIRTRANLAVLDPAVLNTKALVRQAIQDERRLELALEGHRWFDLVRTNTVDDEIGETVNSNYHVFPIPISEILATNGIITQNDGY